MLLSVSLDESYAIWFHFYSELSSLSAPLSMTIFRLSIKRHLDDRRGEKNFVRHRWILQFSKKYFDNHFEEEKFKQNMKFCDFFNRSHCRAASVFCSCTKFLEFFGENCPHQESQWNIVFLWMTSWSCVTVDVLGLKHGPRVRVRCLWDRIVWLKGLIVQLNF